MLGAARTSAPSFVFISFGLINHSKIYTPSTVREGFRSGFLFRFTNLNSVLRYTIIHARWMLLPPLSAWSVCGSLVILSLHGIRLHISKREIVRENAKYKNLSVIETQSRKLLLSFCYMYGFGFGFKSVFPSKEKQRDQDKASTAKIIKQRFAFVIL